MYCTSTTIIGFALSVIFIFAVNLPAQTIKTIQLPQPQKTGGMPLMEALANCKSTREFSDHKISEQVLSNLLWAAYGINRPDGRRTAPTMGNWKVTDVYVAITEGLFKYNANTNILEPILDEDIRALTGTQSFAATAPLNLIYVADLDRIPQKARDENSISTATADSGFIGQNVYLFCASEGLGCVVRRLIDMEPLGEKMGLKPDQRIILAHSVGYPQ